MSRQEDFIRVLDLISLWLTKIKSHNAAGFFDINRLAEGVAQKLLNEIYGYDLENLNYDKKHYPGIDLGDKIKKIGIQISTRKDSRKFMDSLRKFANGPNKTYSNGIRFLILRQEKKPQLNKKKYKQIYPDFDPDQHISTADDLLQDVRRIYDTERQRFYRIKKILEEEVAGEALREENLPKGGNPPLEEYQNSATTIDVKETPKKPYSKDNRFKYFRNYSREDYNLQPQNWCILQGKENGIIYIANQEGLLVYDGASWRSIDIPNQSVHSLAIDDTGTIYVGGRNEFGYLITDEKGSLKYKSLCSYIENDDQIHFTNVWKIHPTKEGIYFHTREFLFRWDPDSQKIEKIDPAPNSSFNASFMCAEELYIRQQNIGFTKMVNGNFIPVKGGEKFAKEGILMMVPYDNTGKKFLIGTWSKGLYIYDSDKNTLSPFETDVDDVLRKKHILHGIRLRSSKSPGQPGEFAFATQLGGLVIIDSFGRLKYLFNKAAGLQDNNVNHIFEDIYGNLWLALNKGIAKIEYLSPISIYDDRSGLTGLVLSVIKYKHDLYVGTTDGLFCLQSSSPSKFSPIPGVPGFCYSMLSTGDYLLAATFEGVFQVKPGIRRITKSASFVLLQSQKNKNRVWMETNNGLTSLYFHPGNKNKIGKWAVEPHRFKGLTADIRTIVEEKNGNLWLGTLTKGVLNVDFSNNNTITRPIVTTYYTSHGLPEGEVHVFWAAGHVVFATNKGIFCFDKIKNKFIPDFTLGTEFAGGSKGVFRISEDNNKNIWFHSDNQNFLAKPGPNGTFAINSEPSLRIPRTQVNTIYIDPDGSVVWFGSHDGLIRFDKTVKKDYCHDFSTIIRRVIANGILIYDGNKTNIGNNLKPSSPTFQYKDRNIRFEFAAPFFEDESKTQY